jgi:hypothetical protein
MPTATVNRRRSSAGREAAEQHLDRDNDPQPGVGSLTVAALFQISDHVARFRDRLVAMPLEMQARGSVNVGVRDHHDQAVSDFRRWRIAVAANHSFSFDHRRRPETLRTAMATAFFWPTRTTRRFPRVTPA